MCGRYTLIGYEETIREQFQIREIGEWLRRYLPRYNIAPTQEAPVVLATAPDQLECLRWCLVPSWAKDPSGAARLINARGETVAEKPAFRAAFRRRRCLVLADGYYEWRRTGTAKQPVRIVPKAPGRVWAFAGIWEEKGLPTGEVLRTFAVITTEPNQPLRAVHDRMPVILDREAQAAWLDAAAEPAALQRLLVPCADDEVDWYPVSTRVNSPRNDDAGCIEPLSA